MEPYLFSRQYAPPRHAASTEDSLKILSSELQHNWKPGMPGLKLEYVPDWWGLELRSPRVFFDPPVECRGDGDWRDKTIRILSYLANLIAVRTNSDSLLDGVWQRTRPLRQTHGRR